ncbi:macro domain-containing protein [Aliivibrio fischeri]|uniref:macro domain-containing protein n=1 Tax=Aliivibrio fischeri TaxID=668 RepID=UPI0007C55B63|nr:macro domain-containing protein [Aliivibrio fischeri]
MILFFRTLFYIIGILSAFVTIISFVNKDVSKLYSGYEICVYSSIAVLSFFISWFITREKKKITIDFTDRVKVNIEYGDLFKQPGVIVIPVNEYFDVIVDDEIISRNTLHGVFVEKFFSDDICYLKEEVDKKLSEYEGVVTNRDCGNNTKYPLGTTIKIQKDDQVFFLIAFTHFNEKNRANTTNLEYQETIIKLIDYIENNSNGYRINIPLIGSGHSGVKAKKQSLLEFLLFSIKMKEDLTLAGGIHIILDKSIKKYIKLKLIDYYYRVLK